MYFLKIKYFLYGILISLSLNFIITQANIADGEFGVYFERMTGICNTGEVITWYSGDSLNFWEKECTPFKEIVGNIFWGSIPANSTVIGFSSTGEIIYAPNHWKENAGNISYTGNNVWIGTNLPTSKLDIVGGDMLVRNISGNIAIWSYDVTKDTSISNGVSFFNAGNVWFGKINPVVAVDVLGDMKVSNTTIVPKIILNGTELKAPPSCFGANQALQWDGTNWSCGTLPTIGSCNTAVANTCTKWTPSGYNAGTCGGNATWTCNGANGWASVSCSKANAACPVNGSCGSANGVTTVSYPTANWCANGTKVDVDTTGGDGTYNWRCDGANLGSDANCSASKNSLPANSCFNAMYDFTTWFMLPATICYNFSNLSLTFNPAPLQTAFDSNPSSNIVKVSSTLWVEPDLWSFWFQIIAPNRIYYHEPDWFNTWYADCTYQINTDNSWTLISWTSTSTIWLVCHDFP